MNKKRLLQTIRLWTITTGGKRAAYLRKKHVFASIGEHCTVMDRKVPLYANLIRLGNNVHLASNVTFVTHDITHKMLNIRSVQSKSQNSDDNVNLSERIGCIDIRDNVFIGTGTTVLYNVRIGSNVIIGAGSLVTRDIPDNSIAVGVPAKVIATMDEYIAKRMTQENYDVSMRPQKQQISPELEKWCWTQFESCRESNKS